MKKLVLLLMVCLVGLLIFRYVQYTRNQPIVAYASSKDKSTAGFQRVRNRGAFETTDHIVPGRPTIMTFCRSGCPSCQTLYGDHFKTLLQLRPDVAIRDIQLANNWNPQNVQKTYHVTIETTPHILIYDSNGTLIAQDEGPNKAGYDFFYKWLNDEIQKDWKKRQTR